MPVLCYATQICTILLLPSILYIIYYYPIPPPHPRMRLSYGDLAFCVDFRFSYFKSTPHPFTSPARNGPSRGLLRHLRISDLATLNHPLPIPLKEWDFVMEECAHTVRLPSRLKIFSSFRVAMCIALFQILLISFLIRVNIWITKTQTCAKRIPVFRMQHRISLKARTVSYVCTRGV